MLLLGGFFGLKSVEHICSHSCITATPLCRGMWGLGGQSGFTTTNNWTITESCYSHPGTDNWQQQQKSRAKLQLWAFTCPRLSKKRQNHPLVCRSPPVLSRSFESVHPKMFSPVFHSGHPSNMGDGLGDGPEWPQETLKLSLSEWEGSQGGDSYGDLASWRKRQTCLTGLLGKVGVLKITSHPKWSGTYCCCGWPGYSLVEQLRSKIKVLHLVTELRHFCLARKKICISVPGFKAMSYIFPFWIKKLFNTNVKLFFNNLTKTTFFFLFFWNFTESNKKSPLVCAFSGFPA